MGPFRISHHHCHYVAQSSTIIRRQQDESKPALHFQILSPNDARRGKRQVHEVLMGSGFATEVQWTEVLLSITFPATATHHTRHTYIHMHDI